MAYILKNDIEFKKQLDNYLKTNPLSDSYEKQLIYNFSSDKLSDLYKLFLDLEDCILTKESYLKLKDILAKFSIDIHKILPINDQTENMSITKNNIDAFSNIIKDIYLSCISGNSNTLIFDDDELYKLALVVNKNFPNVFLDLIKNPNGNIKDQQNFIREKILSTIDHFHLHNSKDSKQEFADIAGGIFITAKKLYPDLGIYIPGRIKSFKSTISNLEKETKNAIFSLLPSNISDGLTDNDVMEQFNLNDANTDFSGLTIVLSNVNDTLHFDKNDPKAVEVLKLRKIRNDYINFTHSLENFLSASENNDYYFSNLELLQIQIDLLTRLKTSTYQECTKEYNNTSFNELLKQTIQKYNDELECHNTSQLYDNEVLYSLEMDKIYQFLDELKNRVDDKYKSKLLEIVIPDILNDPLITDVLKVKSKFVKNVKKKNGFCSLYYSLETATGRKIELQAQSSERYRNSKDGSSDHSALPNKSIDISHFFEPVDPQCDESQFKYFLNILDSTPLATKNVLYNMSDSQLSPMDKRLKKKIKLAEQNIKIKDIFIFENQLSDGTTQSSEYTINQYLPIFAEYISPKLITIHSPHTRFHNSISGYHEKSLITSFIEMLAKHDATTCLSQLLIDKLEELEISDDKNQITINGIYKRSKNRNNTDNISNVHDEH